MGPPLFDPTFSLHYLFSWEAHMFITLMGVTFLISLFVSGVLVAVFSKPADLILQRILSDIISRAWLRYLQFAILVVGISSGVRVWELEKYILPARATESAIMQLTRERWILEVYRTVIGSLQGIAMLLLVFFIFALLDFVVVRAFELRQGKSSHAPGIHEGNVPL
jgi:hypothetical protein